MNAVTKFAAATLFALSSTAAWAQDAHAGHEAHGKEQEAHRHAEPATLVAGEIKKVDKETGKLTIRHGEIKNLGMAPMTMVFRVKDPAMINLVKTGDKVNFAAEKIDGAITVVQIEAAK